LLQDVDALLEIQDGFLNGGSSRFQSIHAIEQALVRGDDITEHLGQAHVAEEQRLKEAGVQGEGVRFAGAKGADIGLFENLVQFAQGFGAAEVAFDGFLNDGFDLFAVHGDLLKGQG